MLEITGDLWRFHGRDEVICCITTNGFLKKNGEAVMGRGCAHEAKNLYPELPLILGEYIAKNGNTFTILNPVRDAQIRLGIFPVKHAWFNDADLQLIKNSAVRLAEYAASWRKTRFILPRPGCGNGRLSWEQVRPVIRNILPDTVFVISKGPNNG